MKYTWIQNNTSNKILIFFNGWGCDHYQFSHIKSDDCDVLMMYDYKELSIEEALLSEIKDYAEINIIAWSYGVWIAQYIWEKYQLPKNIAIAINGTTQPMDDNFGISETITAATLEYLSERNLMKFQRRMVGGNKAWKKFEADKPQREFYEQKEELAALIQHFKNEVSGHDFYQKTIIGSNDLIFSAAKQKAFWQGRAEITEIDAPHFCFYNYCNWDNLLMTE